MQGFFRFEKQDPWDPYLGRGLGSINRAGLMAPSSAHGQAGSISNAVGAPPGFMPGAPPSLTAGGGASVAALINKGKDALKKYLDNLEHPDEPDITVTGEDPSDMGGVGDEIVSQEQSGDSYGTGMRDPFSSEHYTLEPEYSDPSDMGHVGDEIVGLSQNDSPVWDPENYKGTLTGNPDTSNPAFDAGNYEGTLYNGEFGLMDTGPNVSDMGGVGDEIVAQDTGGLMGKVGEAAPYAGMALSAYDMIQNGVTDKNFMGLVGSTAQAVGGSVGGAMAAIPFELSGHGIIGTTLRGLFENRSVDFNSVDPSKLTALDDGNYVYLNLPHGADDTSASLGMFRYNKETGQFETPSGEQWVAGGDGLSEGPDEYQRFEDWTPAQWTSYGGKIYLRDGSHTFSDFYATDGLLGAIQGDNVTALTPDEQGRFNYNGNLYSNGLITFDGSPDWQYDEDPLSGGA